MDYIKSQLLRQQKLWTALFSCGVHRKRSEEPARHAGTEETSDGLPGEIQLTGTTIEDSAPETAYGKVFGGMAHSLFRQTAGTKLGNTDMGGHRSDKELAFQKTTGVDLRTLLAKKSLGNRQIAAQNLSGPLVSKVQVALPSEGIEKSGNVLLSSTSAPALSVQKVSRFVEQDARRYDGGFSLY